MLSTHRKGRLSMKNYRNVSFNRIKDFGIYAEQKLKSGHIIVEIWLNEEKNEIKKLISYANDKNGQAKVWRRTDSEEMKRSSVIVEEMIPAYQFEHPDTLHSRWYPEIESDRQTILDFKLLKDNFSRKLNLFQDDNQCLCLENKDNEKMYCQYYVSAKQGDFRNWGGPLERVFIKEWMSAYGSEKFTSRNRDLVQDNYLKSGETFPDEDTASVRTNIFQHAPEAMVLGQETFLLKNKMFRVHNFYEYESLVLAQDASLIYSKMMYKGKYYLVGQYRLMGACMDDYLEKDYWRPCTNWGSRILKMEQPSESHSTRSRKRSREAFEKDTVETCCWIVLGVYDEAAEIPFDMDYLLSDPVCDRLLNDIVGEIG